MLDSVLGVLTASVAIDLGSTNTRLRIRDQPEPMRAASLIAIRQLSDGPEQVVAVGDPALRMIGRTPPDTTVFHPVRHGDIVDLRAAAAMMRQLMTRAHGRSLWATPRAAVAIPHGVSRKQRRLVRRTITVSGARPVRLIPQPIAAAAGCGLPAEDPRGILLIDLGGGYAGVSLLARGAVAAGAAVKISGDTMDQLIMRRVAEREGLQIGRLEARRLRHEVGLAGDPAIDAVGLLPGEGPRWMELSPALIREAQRQSVQMLGDTTRQLLARAPHRLASDVSEQGAVLVGGCARTPGLAQVLSEALDLPVVVPDAPESVVVRGAEQLLRG